MRTCRRGVTHGLTWPVAAALLILTGVAAPCRAGETLSLTLDQAIEIAVESNRTLGAAEASEEAARARLAQANATFLPKITGSASYTRLDEVPYMDLSQFGDMFPPASSLYGSPAGRVWAYTGGLSTLGARQEKIYLGDDDVYTIALEVQQPLFTGGALVNARAAASHGLRAAEGATRRTKHETAFNVTQAYVNLVWARAALAVANDAVERMRSHLKDLEAMYGEGMILESEVMRARVQKAEVDLGQNSAAHVVRLAVAALAFEMGVDPGTAIDPVDDLTEGGIAERTLEEWTALALTSRPDLEGVSEAVKAAGNAVAIARSEYLPQIVAIGSYAWDRPNRAYEPEFYEHWSATLALEMNIFDWLGRENRVREARANRREAEHGLAMMEDAVKLDVKQSYLELDEAAIAVGISERGVVQARESMRVTGESFRSGVATNSDVLDTQTDLTAAEMNRIAALARLRIAEAGLRLATGARDR